MKFPSLQEMLSAGHDQLLGFQSWLLLAHVVKPFPVFPRSGLPLHIFFFEWA